jgi:hypothetical protein
MAVGSTRDMAVVIHVLNRGRPSVLTNVTHLGLTNAVWEIIEQGWHQDPSARPDVKGFQRALDAS